MVLKACVRFYFFLGWNNWGRIVLGVYYIMIDLGQRFVRTPFEVAFLGITMHLCGDCPRMFAHPRDVEQVKRDSEQ